MNKPDSEGFINVVWPSDRVAHGGIFHTRTIEPSSNQQNFLKVLLEESKLTIAQRQSALQLRREEETRRQNIKEVREGPVIRPRTSRRRSLSTIRESRIYDVDFYQPIKRGEDREKMKERLVNIMAYGDEPQETTGIPRKCSEAPEKPKLPTSKEKWNDLLTQIRERAEWLAEMEYLGQASPHREIMNGQIAERMRALDALGVDSECSTSRSTASGFSTTRSSQPPIKVPSSRSAKSERSSTSGSLRNKMQVAKKTSKQPVKEENVTAYGKMTPLEYSPRRRV